LDYVVLGEEAEDDAHDDEEQTVVFDDISAPAFDG
jgi:hypothetical protein